MTVSYSSPHGNQMIGCAEQRRPRVDGLWVVRTKQHTHRRGGKGSLAVLGQDVLCGEEPQEAHQGRLIGSHSRAISVDVFGPSRKTSPRPSFAATCRAWLIS